MIIKALFLQYLLMPLLALLLVGLMVFVKKKNKIFQNKTLIIYVLVASLIIALPGIGGLAGNMFSPFWYLFAQLFYFLIGIYHVYLLDVYFKRKTNNKKDEVYALLFEILLTVICMTLGGYLFFLLFNWLSPYKGYAWMAMTSIFVLLLPLIFQYTYKKFVDIPFEIYKVWHYSMKEQSNDYDQQELGRLMVVHIELTKTPSDGRLFSIKAKSPSELAFGDWMNRVVEDYNFKNPKSQIETLQENGEQFGWIFYTKPSFFHRRRYLDFEKSVAENRISEKQTVICKRVIQQDEERVITIKN